MIRKSVEGKPKVIEAGQISKGLHILAAQNLKTKEIPMVIWIAQLVKDLFSLFYEKAKKVVGEKVNVIRQDIIAEQTKTFCGCSSIHVKSAHCWEHTTFGSARSDSIIITVTV